MCPACAANLAVIAAGATTSGGFVAFLLRFFRSNKQTANPKNNK